MLIEKICNGQLGSADADAETDFTVLNVSAGERAPACARCRYFVEALKLESSIIDVSFSQ